jgi:hypothetical protein
LTRQERIEWCQARNVAMYPDGDGFLIELGNDLHGFNLTGDLTLESCGCGGHATPGGTAEGGVGA